jgi:hypothetical protein
VYTPLEIKPQMKLFSWKDTLPPGWELRAYGRNKIDNRSNAYNKHKKETPFQRDQFLASFLLLLVF